MNFIREQDIKLAEYLPAFVSQDKEINTLLATESKEHNRQRELLIDILKQFFVHSATWGLDLWEKVFAIYSKPNESYELRRAKIYAKLQSKQISTVEFLTQLASKFFPQNADVKIQEVNPKNLFYLIANYTALDNDYFDLRDAIEIYKPAHLAMLIQHFLDGVGGYGCGGVVQMSHTYSLMQEGFTTNVDGNVDIAITGIIQIYKKYKV
jgi:putative phage protein xkdU|nr:MAG TPA: tail protein [Caudoviricetes sp.]